MTNPFYNPRPAVNFLTLRTNYGFNAAPHMHRPNDPAPQNQPNALPLGEGFAPEIPEAVMEEMIGDRMTKAAESNNPTNALNRGQSNLQSTEFR
tara:strand:- start:333 stop:614 length:282 start_codon:yes stop_codon:yes gene_type:complete